MLRPSRESPDDNASQCSSKSFILCLCMKTIRSKEAKVYFAYFKKGDQTGKIAKHLTARKGLFYGGVFVAAAVVAS